MSRKGNTEVHPQERPYRADEHEQNTRLQYANRQHKVVVKKTGQTFYGLISKVDYDNREFYLLEKDKPGMLGKDGLKFSWDDCNVLAEGDSIGLFSDNMISAWQAYAMKLPVGAK